MREVLAHRVVQKQAGPAEVRVALAALVHMPEVAVVHMLAVAVVHMLEGAVVHMMEADVAHMQEVAAAVHTQAAEDKMAVVPAVPSHYLVGYHEPQELLAGTQMT